MAKGDSFSTLIGRVLLVFFTTFLVKVSMRVWGSKVLLNIVKTNPVISLNWNHTDISKISLIST